MLMHMDGRRRKFVTFYRTLSGALDEFIERRMEWIMLWPILAYSVILYVEPTLFSQAPHYSYLRTIATEQTWELIFLAIATIRIGSLISKMFWAWPYYAPFALVSSIASATLWSQFSLSFLVSYFTDGTVLGPIAAHSTLVLIEFVNVGHSAKGVGQLLKKGF